jgi:hypothetical protein
MANLDKLIYELLTKSSGRATAGSLAAHIQDSNDTLHRGGDIHDALIGDSTGDSVAADVATILTYLEAGGDIHDVLYADAAGASLAADIASIIATTVTGESAGTFSYLDAGGEQTVLEMTLTTRREIKSVWLDVSTLPQDGDWKMYHKFDGSNYREFATGAFTVATDSDGILIDGFTINNDWKITWTEDADEGAARNIPYNVIYQGLE